MVEAYNKKVHRTIGVTPVEASENPSAISYRVMKNNQENESKSRQRKPKFKVGDRVRMFKWKSRFEKGFTAKWTKEIFVVKKVNCNVPHTYELQDLEGEDILGRFYENELQYTDF